MLVFYTKYIRKNYCIFISFHVKKIFRCGFEIGRLYLRLQFDKNEELLMFLRNY